MVSWYIYTSTRIACLIQPWSLSTIVHLQIIKEGVEYNLDYAKKSMAMFDDSFRIKTFLY